MATSDPRREYIRNTIVDALALPSERVSAPPWGQHAAIQLSEFAVNCCTRLQAHEHDFCVAQDWLLQETYRSEAVLTGFLEDANVDLVACSIVQTDSGEKWLNLSNTADLSPSCTFQVGFCDLFSDHRPQSDTCHMAPLTGSSHGDFSQACCCRYCSLSSSLGHSSLRIFLDMFPYHLFQSLQSAAYTMP